MVDKIDRPDPPPAYVVREPTESKRDKPKEERRQEDLPTFQRKEADPYHGKFQADAPSKTFKVPFSEIGQFHFLRAVPRHGVPIVDANLIWKDGTKLPGVSFLLKNWQDFMKIKNLKSGEAIPISFWNYGGDPIEITVRSITTSGPWNMRNIEKQKTEAKSAPQKVTLPWWRNRLSFYGLGALALITLILFLLFR